MKNSLLAGAALALGVSAGGALAADLPSKGAPVVIPPPVTTWTGFYVGLNAGGTFEGSSNVNTNTGVLFIAPALVPAFSLPTALAGTSNIPVSNAGFIGGGQVGYNWQFSPSFVAGVEADIHGVAGADGSANVWNASPVATAPANVWLANTNVSRRVDYLGTVRGRVGYLVTPSLLLYGTGGFAYGGVNTSTNISWFANGAGFVPNLTFFGGASYADTRAGWTAGGGAEWMFWPNWSAKVEYLYYDLGTATTNFIAIRTQATGAAGTMTGTTSTTRFDGHVVRAGVNYHFNFGAAPVVAKY